MEEKKLPDINGIDLDKPVDFSYEQGLLEFAATLDFLPDDETKIQTAKALSRFIVSL